MGMTERNSFWGPQLTLSTYEQPWPACWELVEKGITQGWWLVTTLGGWACLVVSVLSDSWCPMDCSPPGSSVHGILQARVLEWVAVPSSRGSSRPRDRTPVSCLEGRLFTDWTPRGAQRPRLLVSKPPPGRPTPVASDPLHLQLLTMSTPVGSPRPSLMHLLPHFRATEAGFSTKTEVIRWPSSQLPSPPRPLRLHLRILPVLSPSPFLEKLRHFIPILSTGPIFSFLPVFLLGI